MAEFVYFEVAALYSFFFNMRVHSIPLASHRQYVKTSGNGTISLYKLPSVSLVRKYIGLGDLPLAILSSRMVKTSTPETSLLFVSSPGQYLITHKAMRQHSSQLVWFRWLYVIFSRYMMINELEKVS